MRFKLLFLALTVALNVSLPTFGEEVRLIYFKPKGVGPLNPDFMDKQAKELLKDVCNLFESQVGKPFNFEKEDGSDDPKVNYVDGKENYTYYRQGKEIDDEKILDEIRDSDLGAEMSDYLYLITALIGPIHDPNSPTHSGNVQVCGVGNHSLRSPWWTFRDPTGPWAIIDISANCSEHAHVWVTAHELGHAFGLLHDFRDSKYIMSYGGYRTLRNGDQGFVLPDEVSDASIGWLNASRYFNDVLIIDPDQETEISKPVYTYLEDIDELHLQFSISDADGLHQAHLYVSPKNPPPGYRTGYTPKSGEPTLDNSWRNLGKKLTLHNWKQLKGPTETITFIYPKLQENPLDDSIIELRVLDSRGNITRERFTIDRKDIIVKNDSEKTSLIADQTLQTNDSTPPSDINEAAQDARLRTTLRGHTNYVSSVTFSPDGKTLASGSYDKTIRLWNLDTEEHTVTLTGHTDRITSVTFSPNGNILASGSWDRTIRFWNPLTGKSLSNTYSRHTVNETFTSVVAASSDGDSYWFASGSLDNLVWLWYGYGLTQHTNKYKLSGHTQDVSSVAFSTDERTLASGSHDTTIKLWDPYNQKLRATLEGHTNFVTSVAFSPDGRILASGSGDNTIRLWDVVATESIAILEGHTDKVLAVAFSPDSRTLASGSDDQTIRLWDVATHQQQDTLFEHTSGVTAVAFSPDRKTLASAGGWDNTVKLWDLSPSVIPASTVRISPSPVVSPPIGDSFDITIDVSGVQNVAGYQAKVWFDPTALRYIDSSKGTYLPDDAFPVPPVVSRNQVTLAATSLSEDSDGDGTLATLTFEVVTVKPSSITLSDVVIMKRDLTSIPVTVKGSNVVVQSGETLDVNGDTVVNIQDMTIIAAHFGAVGENQADVNEDGVVDLKGLLLVAGQLNAEAAAPSAYPSALSMLTAEDIQTWLSQAQQLDLNGATYQRGIALLQQLLIALTPKETELLPNYPNPFNPETWIPYQLAVPADVSISIYAADGKLIRILDLGHQPIGIYRGKSRAAYWDGRNALGELVASGVYFYTLTAGEFIATRKMLIRK